MLPRTPLCPAIVLALALVVRPGPAPGLSLAPLPPAEVARLAADVVVARVSLAGVTPAPGGAAIEHLRLEVLERWKGAPASVLTLDWWSGPADVPRVRPGETYLFFLPARTPGSDRPLVPATVGGERGVFRAVAHPGGWRFFDLGGAAVVSVEAARWTFAEAPAAATARPTAGPGVTLSPRARDPALPVGGTSVSATWRRLVEAAR
jgi:hypothetical protein